MQFKDVLGHEKIKKLLVEETKTNRISHAQMLLGPSGSAKLPLAIAFSQFLLCENPSETDSCGVCPTCVKIQHNVHPDVHFIYPVVNSKGVKSAEDKRKEWNSFLEKNIYFDLTNWLEFTDEMGKNPQIGVEESRQILKKLALKSFSGKYKIMIIWLPEKMNSAAANKLLKVLEEPPEQTLFFLVCDSIETILPTIISRTQIIKVPHLSHQDITSFLKSTYQIDDDNAQTIANLAEGSVVKALNMISGDKAQLTYFELFVSLMRSAYAIDALKLIDAAETLAAQDKENQKNFLLYGLHIFRESLLTNYLGIESDNLRVEEKDFLKKFARFINNQNISALTNEFNEAYYHLERNANPKILFTDLVIKLTKMIKKGV
jgi:DNA polymerase-3 subunit delta'